MTLPKVVIFFSVLIFAAIGVGAIIKKINKPSLAGNKPQSATIKRVEIDLSRREEIMNRGIEPEKPLIKAPLPQQLPQPISLEKLPEIPLPHANRIEEFFNLDSKKFPIVETITYRSRVSWLKGRPAWLSDYAGHYGTSRHFIARSLNKKQDYFKQDVIEGDRFNVFRNDKNINFYLLVDVTRFRLWFYYIDLDTHQRVLVKDYAVGLGRVDPTRTSGLLTPLGKYSLGDKIAIYKPKMTGFYNGQKVEMMRVFGTRWIPFAKEVADSTEPAKGFGIHGVPWKANDKGLLVEEKSSLGKYQSDGCIRLATEDMEELFAIIITKPTTIELVKDFRQAKLPGTEK
jgi:L,D-transpeptidase-like protein